MQLRPNTSISGYYALAVGNNGQFQAEQYEIFLKTAQLCCISENKMIKRGKALGLKR